MRSTSQTRAVRVVSSTERNTLPMVAVTSTPYIFVPSTVTQYRATVEDSTGPLAIMAIVSTVFSIRPPASMPGRKYSSGAAKAVIHIMPMTPSYPTTWKGCKCRSCSRSSSSTSCSACTIWESSVMPMPKMVSHRGCGLVTVDGSAPSTGRRDDALTIRTPTMLSNTPMLCSRVSRRLRMSTDRMAVKTMQDPETIWLMDALVYWRPMPCRTSAMWPVTPGATSLYTFCNVTCPYAPCCQNLGCIVSWYGTFGPPAVLPLCAVPSALPSSEASSGVVSASRRERVS
mmetsp:Transcript_2150/g.5344  ORF Transcript_2150/g.5344 Transcript_2150/m.5344 type:complete len:286 (-) Transcript_2150:351-1208(-)